MVSELPKMIHSAVKHQCCGHLDRNVLTFLKWCCTSEYFRDRRTNMSSPSPSAAACSVGAPCNSSQRSTVPADHADLYTRLLPRKLCSCAMTLHGDKPNLRQTIQQHNNCREHGFATVSEQTQARRASLFAQALWKLWQLQRISEATKRVPATGESPEW